MKIPISTSRAFDLIKILAALLLVAAHCSFLEEYPNLNEIRQKFTNLCIPLFFIISSYLFTIRLINNQSNSPQILKKTIIRLSILFGIWYVLMLPITWVKWFSIATMKETIAAIIFHCTFSGYWFIKALIINTFIIYFCFKSRKFTYICSILFFIYYIVTAYNYIFHFIRISYSPYYHFGYHVIPCIIGMLAAQKGTFNILQLSPKLNPVLLLLAAILVIKIDLFEPIFRILGAYLVCASIGNITMPEHLPYKFMRNASTIIYMLQFALIFIYSKFEYLHPSLEHSIARTIIVSVVIIAISIITVYLSKTEYGKKLEYLY